MWILLRLVVKPNMSPFLLAVMSRGSGTQNGKMTYPLCV